MVDLPDKYKKTVDGVVVEMTEQEKNSVDADIIATNELLRIQAEIDRQNNKNPMLKQIENLYVVFLTNDWTKILQSKSILSSNITINVTNTPYMQNMVYLMTLRAIDRDNYVKYASEFKLFEETINDVFSSSIGDVVWHDLSVAKLAWDAPTNNTDESSLVNLKGYNLDYINVSSSSMPKSNTIFFTSSTNAPIGTVTETNIVTNLNPGSEIKGVPLSERIAKSFSFSIRSIILTKTELWF
jgi:hypothetical protein